MKWSFPGIVGHFEGRASINQTRDHLEFQFDDFFILQRDTVRVMWVSDCGMDGGVAKFVGDIDESAAFDEEIHHVEVV